MTSAAITDCHALLAAVCALPEKVRLSVISAGSPYNTLENNTLPPLEKGNFQAQIANAAKAHRAQVVGGISDAVVRAMLDPVMLTYGVAIRSPWSDPVRIFDDVYDRFVLSGLTVASRAFSFGAVATGAGIVGNGTVHRCTADYNAKTIESPFGADTITVKCIRDVAVGGANRHEEAFEIRGLPVGIDRGYERGSGEVVELTALSARSSQANGIVNPSFSQVAPTTSGSIVTTLTGWALYASGGSALSFGGAGASNLTVRTSSGLYYRDSVGDSSPKAIAFAKNYTLKQSAVLAKLKSDVPYLMQIAYKPASRKGKIHLIVGDQSVSASLSGASGWNKLVMTMGQKCWARAFDTTSPVLAIKTTSGTAGVGSVIVDDVVVGTMTKRDSLFYGVIGGTTKFLVDDKFTFTDTETGSIVQRWLSRAYKKYLPGTGGSPTVTEPTVS